MAVRSHDHEVVAALRRLVGDDRPRMAHLQHFTRPATGGREALPRRPEGFVVLVRMLRGHDLDNLYVVDDSFFPSNAAVSHALTIIAKALRVGDRLIGYYNSNILPSLCRQTNMIILVLI